MTLVNICDHLIKENEKQTKLNQKIKAITPTAPCFPEVLIGYFCS